MLIGVSSYEKVKMRRTAVRLLLFLVLPVLGGCAVLPDNSNRSVTTTYTSVSNPVVDNIYANAPRKGDNISGFLLLDNGLDAFVARAVLAQIAERSIDTQYYMIHGDAVGSLFVDQLLQAANRGVRVRVLLDDINEGDRDFDIAIFDMHPNIEVRIFNPFGRNVGRLWQYVTGFGRQTRWAHNKSFTIDGKATILGGRNIGDEYFSHNPELDFQDLDVLAIGPVARETSDAFDRYWNHELSYPASVLFNENIDRAEAEERKKCFEKRIASLTQSPYLQRLKNSDLARKMRDGKVHFEWGPGRVYVDPPGQAAAQGWGSFLPDVHRSAAVSSKCQGRDHNLFALFRSGKGRCGISGSIEKKGGPGENPDQFPVFDRCKYRACGLFPLQEGSSPGRCGTVGTQ